MAVLGFDASLVGGREKSVALGRDGPRVEGKEGVGLDGTRVGGKEPSFPKKLTAVGGGGPRVGGKDPSKLRKKSAAEGGGGPTFRRSSFQTFLGTPF